MRPNSHSRAATGRGNISNIAGCVYRWRETAKSARSAADPLPGVLLGGALEKQAAGRRGSDDFQKRVDAERERLDTRCRRTPDSMPVFGGGTPNRNSAVSQLVKEICDAFDLIASVEGHHESVETESDAGVLWRRFGMKLGEGEIDPLGSSLHRSELFFEQVF